MFTKFFVCSVEVEMTRKEQEELALIDDNIKVYPIQRKVTLKNSFIKGINLLCDNSLQAIAIA